MAQELIQGVEPSALPAGVKGSYTTAGGNTLLLDKPFYYVAIAKAIAPQAVVAAPIVNVQANRPFLWIATAWEAYVDAAGSNTLSAQPLPNVDAQISLTDIALMAAPVPLTALAGAPNAAWRPLQVPYWLSGNTTISASFTNNESVANGHTYADIRLIFIGFQYKLKE